MQLTQTLHEAMTSQILVQSGEVLLSSSTGDLDVKKTGCETPDTIGGLANQALLLKFHYKHSMIAHPVPHWHHTGMSDHHITSSPYPVDGLGSPKESGSMFLPFQITDHLQHVQPIPICQQLPKQLNEAVPLLLPLFK
jgi:hypothetical protein